MKCLRILPEIWARTLRCPARSTRNIVPGNTWVTVPSVTICCSFGTSGGYAGSRTSQVTRERPRRSCGLSQDEPFTNRPRLQSFYENINPTGVIGRSKFRLIEAKKEIPGHKSDRRVTYADDLDYSPRIETSGRYSRKS